MTLTEAGRQMMGKLIAMRPGERKAFRKNWDHHLWLATHMECGNILTLTPAGFDKAVELAEALGMDPDELFG